MKVIFNIKPHQLYVYTNIVMLCNFFKFSLNNFNIIFSFNALIHFKYLQLNRIRSTYASLTSAI